VTPAGRRRKGHSFERWVADAYRARFDGYTVRRSQQSGGAYEPDVVVEGLSLWTECQHANEPTPLLKLAQAERDASAAGGFRLPVVVWKRSGSRVVNVTLRLWTLVWTLGDSCRVPYEAITTVDLAAWLPMTLTDYLLARVAP
jgi:hypothetical protein